MNEEVGLVTASHGYLISLDGLPTVRINDMIQGDKGERGWISNIYPNRVEAFLVDEAEVKPGAIFRKTNTSLTITVKDTMLGRTINPLGIPIDGKGPIGKTANDKVIRIDSSAPDITTREVISDQFDTGVILTDTLIPIGRGQRELILGDARSGTWNYLISTIVNQGRKSQVADRGSQIANRESTSDQRLTSNNQVVCIYAAIGKSVTDIRRTIDTLETNHALKYSIIIAASSTDPAPLIFLTPQTAFAIAEYFQKSGLDVFIVLDDLGNHAKTYREMSLLSSRIPGRESYPGDIFYQHAHLLEKAGKFKKEFGGGSITAMPVIEINLNDFTTLIPTNLMAMTDGHLLFKSGLYNKGQRPAIDLSLSVSRIGLKDQSVIQKLVGSKIKSVLAQASQLKTLQSFSAELSSETQLLQKQAQIFEELLKQEELTDIPQEIQVSLLLLTMTQFFTSQDINFVARFKTTIIQAFSQNADLNKLAKQIYSLKTEEEALTLLEQAIPTLEAVCK